jgi:hypothetical protein
LHLFLKFNPKTKINMDSLINAGKEYLSEQLSGSGSGSHQGQGQGQGMCRNPSSSPSPSTPATNNKACAACPAILEANKHLRWPSSSRKQSVTIPPHNLLPNEYLVLTRSLSILYTDAYGGAYPAGGDFHHEDEELRTAHQQASQYAGSSGNNEIFSSVINSISQKKGHLANSDIDEQG